MNCVSLIKKHTCPHKNIGTISSSDSFSCIFCNKIMLYYLHLIDNSRLWKKSGKPGNLHNNHHQLLRDVFRKGRCYVFCTLIIFLKTIRELSHTIKILTIVKVYLKSNTDSLTTRITHFVLYKIYEYLPNHTCWCLVLYYIKAVQCKYQSIVRIVSKYSGNNYQ